MLYLRVFYYGTYCIILAGFKYVPLKWLKTFQGWETYEKNSELYIYLFLYKDWHESIWDLLHSLLLLASLFVWIWQNFYSVKYPFSFLWFVHMVSTFVCTVHCCCENTRAIHVTASNVRFPDMLSIFTTVSVETLLLPPFLIKVVSRALKVYS